MATTKSKQSTLIFRGPPEKLLCQDGDIPAELKFELETDNPMLCSGKLPRLKVRRTSDGHIRLAKVKVDKYTQAGTYNVALRSKNQTLPAQLEIEERARLSMSPSQLSIKGKPCEKVMVSVVVTNKGNVAIDIPINHFLGIFEDNGVETAFATTYRMEEEDPLLLLRNFFLKLREGHGGMLKMRIKQGFGNLPPRTSKVLLIEAQLPEKLRPGHGYHGIWSLLTFDFTVTVAVEE